MDRVTFEEIVEVHKTKTVYKEKVTLVINSQSNN